MIAYALIVGGIAAVVLIVAAVLVIRGMVSDRLARAWAYGYNTRGYDDVTGVVSPNPYDNRYPDQEFFPSEPVGGGGFCHVTGCVKHDDGMHVDDNGFPVHHEPCTQCLVDDVTELNDRLATLLTDTATALKGTPHPLTSHDWSDLPAVATAAMTAEPCGDLAPRRVSPDELELTVGPSCVIRTVGPHAGKHRGLDGTEWTNMAGFRATKIGDHDDD